MSFLCLKSKRHHLFCLIFASNAFAFILGFIIPAIASYNFNSSPLLRQEQFGKVAFYVSSTLMQIRCFVFCCPSLFLWNFEGNGIYDLYALSSAYVGQAEMNPLAASICL